MRTCGASFALSRMCEQNRFRSDKYTFFFVRTAKALIRYADGTAGLRFDRLHRLLSFFFFCYFLAHDGKLFCTGGQTQ